MINTKEYEKVPYILLQVLLTDLIIPVKENRSVINDNNSIQFFIINVPCQQLQRQIQTQHSVHIGNKLKSNNKSITNINSIKAN
jgi:hypothetical protein